MYVFCFVLLWQGGALSLSDMATNPQYCADAYIDPTIAVPEIVMSCIRYLQRVDHVPGVLLTHLDSPLVPKIKVCGRYEYLWVIVT